MYLVHELFDVYKNGTVCQFWLTISYQNQHFLTTIRVHSIFVTLQLTYFLLKHIIYHDCQFFSECVTLLWQRCAVLTLPSSLSKTSFAKSPRLLDLRYADVSQNVTLKMLSSLKTMLLNIHNYRIKLCRFFFLIWISRHVSKTSINNSLAIYHVNYYNYMLI